MTTTKKAFSIGAAILLIALVALLALDAATPAFSADLMALLATTSTPLPGESIPLKSIKDLESLNATIKIDANGLIDGQRVQGDLNGVLTSSGGNSQVTVSGSLLGQIAAQVGGSLVGLFTPSKVDLYKTADGAYVVVNGLFPVCVKPKAAQSTAALDDMSPQSMLELFTDSDVARGKFVGDEKLNGVPVRHYVLNGKSFLTAAKNSTNPKLKAFGEALWSAEDADAYVDAKGGYPVAFNGSFSGTYEPLGFEGDFDVQIQLTGVNNSNTTVKLPSACNNPISQ